jgi:hypothetical protein
MLQCHFMVQPGAILWFKAHWVLNWVVYSSMGGAKRTMMKDILAKIDDEIARLEQAKALLSATGTVRARRKPGRPAKVATAVTPKVQNGLAPIFETTG